ncbi:MAG: DUF5664 domain-containing protein [Thermoguttaceae bacterium]|nr:DUF5664 domain-containing protein [Thermoguttaceae bacterium]
MKNDLILFPKDMIEPETGEIIQAKDGYWYLCVLGTDCADCDIDCEDTSTCEYKPICSCFKRKEFSSVVFRYIRNLPDIAEAFTKENDATITSDKEQFSTGAMRDKADEKPRPELISPFAIERLAYWLRDGAHKYGDRNWEAGMPTERTVASLLRHIMKYMQGDGEEDNLAAIMCNAMFLLDVDEKVKRGILPDSLQTLPTYSERETKKLFPLAMERVKEWINSGSEKWTGLITAKECLENLQYHLCKFEDDDHSVDHLAAALANLLRIVHIDEGVKRGLLPSELLELPTRRDNNPITQ